MLKIIVFGEDVKVNCSFELSFHVYIFITMVMLVDFLSKKKKNLLSIIYYKRLVFPFKSTQVSDTI